jgi:hypothetical protein
MSTSIAGKTKTDDFGCVCLELDTEGLTSILKFLGHCCRAILIHRVGKVSDTSTGMEGINNEET